MTNLREQTLKQAPALSGLNSNLSSTQNLFCALPNLLSPIYFHTYEMQKDIDEAEGRRRGPRAPRQRAWERHKNVRSKSLNLKGCNRKVRKAG